MDSTITLAPGIWSWTWRSRILKQTETERDMYRGNKDVSGSKKTNAKFHNVSNPFLALSNMWVTSCKSFTAAILPSEFYLKAASVKAKLWWKSTPQISQYRKVLSSAFVKVDGHFWALKRLWAAGCNIIVLSNGISATNLMWICWLLESAVQHHLLEWDIKLFKTTISQFAFEIDYLD